jgi:hypothetical protein
MTSEVIDAGRVTTQASSRSKHTYSQTVCGP